MSSLEVVGFACVPVAVGDRPACRHPEELALLSLVSAGSPEVLMAHAYDENNVQNQVLNEIGCS